LTPLPESVALRLTVTGTALCHPSALAEGLTVMLAAGAVVSMTAGAGSSTTPVRGASVTETCPPATV
jgi:hypothetical protein